MSASPRAILVVLLLLVVPLAGCAQSDTATVPTTDPTEPAMSTPEPEQLVPVEPADDAAVNDPVAGGHHGEEAPHASGFDPATLTPVDPSTEGLPASRPTEEVRLENGSTFELVASRVAHDTGNRIPVRMFAYNGMIPGPTLRLPQHAEVTIEFTNELPYETTVHWHGLRLDPAFDGVPGISQAPVAPGETFTYTVRAPDEGVFWYHPHVREDIQQDLGLSGAIIVDGPRADDENWPREYVVLLDDLLFDGTQLAPHYEEVADRSLMGRFGSKILANGIARSWNGEGERGERVRLHFVNVANARPFHLQFDGAEALEQIASDGGYLQAPTPIDSVTLAPSERATVDVVVAHDHHTVIHHVTPTSEHTIGYVHLKGTATEPDAGAPLGPHERAKASLADALAHSDAPVDVRWQLDLRVLDPTLDVTMHGGHGDHGGHDTTHDMSDHDAADDAADDPHAGHHADGTSNVDRSRADPSIEWEDTMPDMNAETTSHRLEWIFRDADTGRENHDMRPVFQQGTLVNILIENLGDSDHPMQHPIHLHGQRFVVQHVNGVANPMPAWKDTVLVPAGQSALITVEMSNPGVWMVHCHISEHMESGMMTSFAVE